MMKLFTRLYVALAVVVGVFWAQNAKATHIMGSDISFRCLGGNNYEVVVAIYRDCSGITMPSSITINAQSSCGTSSVTCNLDANTSNLEVSQLCPTAVSTCNNGSLPGVELYTYVGNITIQPNCGIYTFSYDDCCRNTSNNLFDAAPPSLGFYVEATLNSDLLSCDNAPTFTSLPVPYFCVNQPVNYSHGALDIDGDSLVYKLITPLDQSGSGLAYSGSYTAPSPLPTSSGFNFDSNSGQMTFTPTMQGVYVVDVLVSEYRNGVLIGTTMRDIQIVVINCTNNSPIVQNAFTPTNVTGGVISDYNSVGVCPGTQISFTIGARDPDGQPVTVTSNIASSIPGATLTTTTVGGTDSVLATFTWTPSPLDTGFRYFTIQFEDNACPITGLQLFTYDITIFDGTDGGPDRFYCPSGGPIEVDVYGGSHFSWNTTTGMVSATPDSNVVFLAPSATTTYIIESDLLGGCKNRDTITVFAVPSFTTTLTSLDDTVCLHQSTTITVTPSPSSQGPFTYHWTNVGDGVLNPTQATTEVKPNGNTVYNVVVVSSSGCTVRDSFPIYITGVGPKVGILPSANNVCPGTVVTLNASVSAVDCGPVANPQQVCGPGSIFDIQDLGTGTANAANGTTPYTGFYDDGRVQYLYLASELQAMGLAAGTITDVAFNIATKNSTQPYNAFTIKMGCTSLQELPSTYVSGLSQVLNPVSYSTYTGWNNHTLDIPYNWDGFSNLIIEICYDNSTFTGYDYVYYTPTGFNNSVLWDVQDLASTSGCSALNSPTQGKNRPNTELVMCKAPLNNYSFAWTSTNGPTLPDSSTVSTAVNHDITYNLTVSDGFCEGDTFINLTVDPSVLISAGNDTAFCGNDTVQLNMQIINPVVPFCVAGYDLSSIPYAAISPTGAVIAGPTGDDNVGGAVALSFPFDFYCNAVSQYFISTNGFISFTAGQGSGCCSGQQLPDVSTPNNLIALCWEDLNTNNGGNIEHFVSGTAPNRVEVIRFKNVAYFGSGGNITGEIHLYETTNVIDILVSSQNNPGQTNTLGLENATGTSGISPAGYNASSWVVSSPVAFRFTPQTGGNAVTSVHWSPSAGLSADSVANPKAYPSVTTNYVVTATFTSGCVVTDTVKVSIGNFPHSVTVSNDSICPGDTVQLAFVGNGVSYTWTPANTLSSASIKNPLAFPQNTTTYHVVAFDSVGCRADDTARVNIKGNGPVTLANDTIICPYDSLILSPSGAPYLSYLWSTGATTPTISTGAQTATAQNYFVRVFDGICYHNSDTLTLGEFILNPIGVQPSGDTGMCVGDTITLAAEAGYTSYQWSNGATTQFILVNTAGDFSYVAVDVNGCILNSLDTTTVALGQPPVADIIANTNPVCEGQPNLIYVNPVAGVDYYWSPGGALTDSFYVTAAGTYYLTANNNGCLSLDSVTLTSVAPPVINLGDDINVCGCDTVVTISSSQQWPGYLWSNGATTQSTTVNSTGTYTLTITDANNCSATDALDVNIRCLTVNAFVADPPTGTVFVGRNATLNVDSFSYNGSFTYLWTPSVYLQDSAVQQPYVQSPQSTTTYTVQVTDMINGCVAYDSVRLAVVPPGVPPMPNAFTPNGDGHNDVYGPYFPPSLQGSYTIVLMRIYNRWGQMVYNGNGYWDGTFNGALQQAGTYFYYITIEGPDQNNPNVNVNYNLTGSFTLLH